MVKMDQIIPKNAQIFIKISAGNPKFRLAEISPNASITLLYKFCEVVNLQCLHWYRDQVVESAQYSNCYD